MIRLLWAGLVLLLLGCEQKTISIQPKFLSGQVEKFTWSTHLQSGLNGQPFQPWARQQAILVLTVDSLGDSGTVLMHATLDSLTWHTADRDSIETFYMVARLKQTLFHFRLWPDGRISQWVEEPTLPSLSPSWLSPAQLLAWAFPFWAPPRLTSNTPWTTEINWPESPCHWHRQNEFRPNPQDTLSWSLNIKLAPGMDSASACPEPAWTGAGEILGLVGGLGLKEFKLKMQADFPFPSSGADSVMDSTNREGLPSSLTLIRSISLRRL